MVDEAELHRAGLTATTEEQHLIGLTGMTIGEAKPWLQRRAAERAAFEKKMAAEAGDASIQKHKEAVIRSQFSALSGGSL